MLYFVIMDISDPTRAVTPTLDGPVLAALAVAGHPMTAGEIAQHTIRGSEIGVRRCLARLVDEGIVKASELGRNRVHELNREHLAAEVAEILAGLRPALFDRIRSELGRWKPKPHLAIVFGSLARRDGDVHSDIDVLLVHIPFPGDPKPPKQGRMRDSLAQMWAEPPPGSISDAKKWSGQIDKLKNSIYLWTGNPAHVIDLSWAEWLAHKDDDGVFGDIRRDGIDVTP